MDQPLRHNCRRFFCFGSVVFSLEYDSPCLDRQLVSWEPFCLSDSRPVTYHVVFRQGVVPPVDDKTERWKNIHSSGCICAVYSDNGRSHFSLCYVPGQSECNITVSPESMQYLQYALQYALMTLLCQNHVWIHCVSLILDDQLILLSAPSGTGKTTLGNLLHSYSDAAVVNGDYAFLTLSEDGKVFFEPTPFCGSSHTCCNYRLSVDRISFLSQSAGNNWQDLNSQQAYARLLENIFLPSYDLSLRNAFAQNALSLVERIPINSYAFAPTRDAAVLYSKTVLQKKFQI